MIGVLDSARCVQNIYLVNMIKINIWRDYLHRAEVYSNKFLGNDLIYFFKINKIIQYTLSWIKKSVGTS